LKWRRHSNTIKCFDYANDKTHHHKVKLFVFCHDLKTGRQLWLKEFANPVAPVKVGNMVSSKVGVAFCHELATGKELWRQRLNVGVCWALPLAAGDRIYLFSNVGKTIVLRAGAKYEELAVNTIKDLERVYGVAAVDGALLLRSGKKLIRLSER
jgi:outer membrane protein assembly factor BamB